MITLSPSSKRPSPLSLHGLIAEDVDSSVLHLPLTRDTDIEGASPLGVANSDNYGGSEDKGGEGEGEEGDFDEDLKAPLLFEKRDTGTDSAVGGRRHTNGHRKNRLNSTGTNTIVERWQASHPEICKRESESIKEKTTYLTILVFSSSFTYAVKKGDD